MSLLHVHIKHNEVCTANSVHICTGCIATLIMEYNMTTTTLCELTINWFGSYLWDGSIITTWLCTVIKIAIVAAAFSVGDSRTPHLSRIERELDILPNLTESTAANQTTVKAPMYSVLDETEQGFVNLGALQSFTTALTSQEKEDVINSILLAQLTASHMYNRETQYIEWYETYVKALVKLGWMVDSYRFMEHNPPDKTINLAEATLNLLRLLCVKPLQLQVTSLTHTLSLSLLFPPPSPPSLSGSHPHHFPPHSLSPFLMSTSQFMQKRLLLPITNTELHKISGFQESSHSICQPSVFWSPCLTIYQPHHADGQWTES